jgi:hypothetical protein
LAAIRTRLSLAIMSAVDGSALVAYQGARARCSATSAGSWPAVAYQMMARVWQVRVNGTVARTARAVRLRACPVPKTCLASSMATDAPPGGVPFDDLGGAGVQAGGDQGNVVAGAGAVAYEDDLDGTGAEGGVPQVLRGAQDSDGNGF